VYFFDSPGTVMLSTTYGIWHSPQGTPIPRIMCFARPEASDRERDLLLVKKIPGKAGLSIRPTIDVTLHDGVRVAIVQAYQKAFMYEADTLLVPKETIQPTQYIEIKVCNCEREQN